MATFAAGEDATGGRLTRAHLLALLLIAAAVALRLWHFAGGRSLWIDEASIALNIGDLPFAALAGHLHFDQMAPAAWLVLQKAVYAVWPNDYGLRFPSLVAGLAALGVFWRLSQRLLDEREALVALALFGLTSGLVWHSAQVKPYIFDVLFCAAILLIGMRLLEPGADRRRQAVLLAILGAACVAFSYGALLVLASTGLLLGLQALYRREWRWAFTLAIIGALWACLFLGTYWLVRDTQQGTLANMTQVYWTQAFGPLPTRWADVLWWGSRTLGIISHLTEARLPSTLAFLAVVGGLALLRTRPGIAALLAGPFLAAALASVAQLYPYSGRLQIYLAPPLFLLVARGAGALAGLLRSRSASALAALAAAAIALPAAATLRRASASPPWGYEEAKINLERFAKARSPGDILLVTWTAERPLLHYSEALGLRGLSYRVSADLRRGADCAQRDLAHLPPSGRLWLLTYHQRPTETEARRQLLDGLAARGRLVLEGDELQSKLYRADLSRSLPAGAVPARCVAERQSIGFVRQLAERRGLTPLAPDGRPEFSPPADDGNPFAQELRQQRQ